MDLGRQSILLAAAAILAGCGMFGSSETDEDSDPRNLTGNRDFYRAAESSPEALLFRRTTSLTYEVYLKRGDLNPATFDRVAVQDADLAMREVCGVSNLTYVSAPIPRGDDARVVLIKCGRRAGRIVGDNNKLGIGVPAHSKND